MLCGNGRVLVECVLHRAEYAPSDYHGELRKAQRAKWSLDRYQSSTKKAFFILPLSIS